MLYFNPTVDAVSSEQLVTYLKLSTYLSAGLCEAALEEPRAEHSTVLLLLKCSGCSITASHIYLLKDRASILHVCIHRGLILNYSYRRHDEKQLS